MNQLQVKELHNVLKFKCKKCGKCCDSTFIQLYPFDIKNICKKLNIKTKELNQKYLLLNEIEGIPRTFIKNRPTCPFKEDNQCTIYENRPIRCKLFPLGRVFKEKKILHVLPEEKCVGFQTGKKQTVSGWLKNEEILEFEELTKNWNHFIINLKDNPILKEPMFKIIFQKAFYDFDDPFIKSQREKLRKEKGLEEFMENLYDIFNSMKDNLKSI